jgi:hypothetical protein
MPRPIVNDPRRQPKEASPQFTRLLVLAFLIAALIGIGGGLMLVGWNLIRVYLWH